MKTIKTYVMLTGFLGLFAFNSFAQLPNVDSVMNKISGEWKLIESINGMNGLPSTLYNQKIVISKVENEIDQINYKLYLDDTLYRSSRELLLYTDANLAKKFSWMIRSIVIKRMQAEPASYPLPPGTLLYTSSSYIYLDEASNLIIAGDGYDAGSNKYARIQNVTVIDESILNTKLTVSPNPAMNKVNFEGIEAIDKIEIYTSNGKLAIQSFSVNIDITDLSSGIYIAKVFAKKQLITTKIIKE